MRCGDHDVELEQRMILAHWIRIPDIDPRPGDTSALERVVEGAFVDDPRRDM